MLRKAGFETHFMCSTNLISESLFMKIS